MVKALSLVVLLSACHTDHLVAATKCGKPCSTQTNPIHPCKGGVWSCTGDTDEDATCVGEVFPTDEVCDNIDNNCDGEIDNLPGKLESNQCGSYITICEYGKWNSYGVKAPKPEICDGIDNDCNGLIDDNISFSSPYCYDGPTSSIGKGECRPGFTECIAGRTVCNGEVLPKAEICDGKDNDCNGVIDNDVGTIQPIDIIFVIDNSGSMADKIARVKVATNLFAIKYGPKAYIKWGLVTAPDDDGTTVPKLRRNLDTATNFNITMQMQSGQTGSGDEPTLDAFQMICSIQSDPLGISWTPGSKKVVVLFSDEIPQSYVNPPNDETSVANLCVAAGVEPFVFSDNGWAQFVQDTGGTLFSIYDSATDIETNLDKVVQDEVCQ